MDCAAWSGAGRPYEVGVAMARPLWFVGLLKRSFAGRFLMARLTKALPIGRAVDRLLFAGDDIIYLPQDRVIPVNQSVELPAEMVLPSQVVERFIEQANVHWIMNACICRDAAKCRDYPIDLGCLFLGEAALGINPQLGRRVTKEEALAHARRCREAGLVHMIGRNKLDTVWLGVGPGDRLLTICNCCPCCCLWRFIPDIAPRIAGKVTRMPGVHVEVSSACTGCGTCSSVCFAGTIKQVDGKSVILEGCLGCGKCVEACPNSAITLHVDDSLYVDKAIGRLEKVISVE
jgi:ferredoxin